MLSGHLRMSATYAKTLQIREDALRVIQLTGIHAHHGDALTLQTLLTTPLFIDHLTYRFTGCHVRVDILAYAVEFQRDEGAILLPPQEIHSVPAIRPIKAGEFDLDVIGRISRVVKHATRR